MNRIVQALHPFFTSSFITGLSLLLICLILPAGSSWARQRDFTSQVTERLHRALSDRSMQGIINLSEPGETPVAEDFFDRYTGFDLSVAQAYGLQQFGTVGGNGQYVTGVFMREQVARDAHRWLLVNVFKGPQRRLNLEEVQAAIDGAQSSEDRYDGFGPLAHDARFIDFSLAVNRGDERLLAYLDRHGISVSEWADLAPLDHHGFYLLDGVRAARQTDGSTVGLRFLWAYLPSGEGRISSGWYLRYAGEQPGALAVAAERETGRDHPRDGIGSAEQSEETRQACCEEARRLRQQVAEEQAARETLVVEHERRALEGERLRAAWKKAVGEQRTLAIRLDSLETANRLLREASDSLRAHTLTASNRSDLRAGFYSLIPGGGQFYKGNFRRGVTYASVISAAFVTAALTQRGVDGADKLFQLRRARVQELNFSIRTCEGCTARDRERMIARRDQLIVKRDAAKATRSDRRVWRNLALAAGVSAVAVSIIDSIELDRIIAEKLFHRKGPSSGALRRVILPRLGWNPATGAASFRWRVDLN